MISYSLLTSADDRFSINSTTGEISVDKSTGSSIDFETASSHEIMVEASDGTNAGTAIVLILIADINDNMPIFLQPSYTISVSETVAIGTTILAVQVSTHLCVTYSFFIRIISFVYYTFEPPLLIEIYKCSRCLCYNVESSCYNSICERYCTLDTNSKTHLTRDSIK